MWDLFIPDTVFISIALAFSAVPSYWRGATACLGSSLCDETQLGESGQMRSLPPVTLVRDGNDSAEPAIIMTSKNKKYLGIIPSFISAPGAGLSRSTGVGLGETSGYPIMSLLNWYSGGNRRVALSAFLKPSGNES